MAAVVTSIMNSMERFVTGRGSVERVYIRLYAAAYRATDGRIGGRYRKTPTLLLMTIGRKSGLERVTPVIYLADGDRFIIAASHVGASKHPAWWLNLRECPETTIRVGPATTEVTATELAAEERERLWSRFDAMYPEFRNYRARTARVIPLIALTPRTTV